MSGLSRRRFLGASAIAAGAGVLATACTAADDDSRVSAPADDLDTASIAAGVEQLAFDTYTVAGRMILDGELGAAIPPAVATFLATATGHHHQALNSWNKVLVDAGRPEVTAPREALRTVVDLATARLTDIPGVALLGLRLEDYAAQTYQKAISTLKSTESVTLAAQITVVSHQRQAILRYLLGLYPVGRGTATDPIDFAPANPTLSLLTG